jgi:hypothetical protein
MFHADRRSDMTKLTVDFRSFANAPKNDLIIRVQSKSSHNGHYKNEPQGSLRTSENVLMCAKNVHQPWCVLSYNEQ